MTKASMAQSGKTGRTHTIVKAEEYSDPCCNTVYFHKNM